MFVVSLFFVIIYLVIMMYRPAVSISYGLGIRVQKPRTPQRSSLGKTSISTSAL